MHQYIRKIRIPRFRSSLLALCIITYSASLNAQCHPNQIDSIPLVKHFSNPAFGNFLSIKKDRLNRPLIYTSTKDGGLQIYSIQNGSVSLYKHFPVASFANLDVINIVQQDHYLYVCLGDIWNTNERLGLAVMDVGDIHSIRLLDTLFLPELKGGIANVFLQGNIAFMAGMQAGLILVDITQKNNLQLLSRLPFSNDFPHHDSNNSSAYNARGVWVKDSIAFVCYDRGGLRMVNISNPHQPVQISQYCRSDLIDSATAYNNLWISQDLAYVAIDYYGMEVLDISNPHQIKPIGFWHPADWAKATTNFQVWSQSKGHANEIYYDAKCEKVYLAAGNTDAIGIDVSLPSNPETCSSFMIDADHYGSWGIDYHRDSLYLTYIWSPFFPPYSNYTGFCIYATQDCTTSTSIKIPSAPMSSSLKYAVHELKVIAEDSELPCILTVYNAQGYRILQRKISSSGEHSFPFLEWPEGIFIGVLRSANSFKLLRFSHFH